MSMARVVITAVVLEGRSKSEVARDYGLSRLWVRTLVNRFLTEGDSAFQPRSRRPHTSPGRVVTEAGEELIIGLRKELAEQGLDAGAETIRWHLSDRGQPAPSVATIWRVLSRRGFLTPQPQKRPRSSWRRFEADQPNECWQADVTHWPLAGGTDAEILDVIDDHSRLLIGSTTRKVFTSGTVLTDLTTAFTSYGRPERVLTDNGAIFTAAYRGHGWVALERECVALGIALRHSRPYHPQTCGKVERVHQTIKKWLSMQPTPTTIAELQDQLDTFRAYYNHQRPHRAINRRAPAAAYTALPKALPSRQGIRVSEHFRVRRDRVDTDGKLTLRHSSRLHHIGIGRAWAGTAILMLIRELNIRIITEDTGELVRELVLDPTRDYQAQAR
ncbi:MAG: IS481 family transposase [Actinobacteria bacterium]|nr:IS481 family transposase [Actinomycetota bacterium]